MTPYGQDVAPPSTTGNMEATIGQHLGNTIASWQQLHSHPEYPNHVEDENAMVMHQPAYHTDGVTPLIDPQTGQPHMQRHPELTELYRNALMNERKLQALHDAFQANFQAVNGPAGQSYLQQHPTKPVAKAQMGLRNTAMERATKVVPISQGVM